MVKPLTTNLTQQHPSQKIYNCRMCRKVWFLQLRPGLKLEVNQEQPSNFKKKYFALLSIKKKLVDQGFKVTER